MTSRHKRDSILIIVAGIPFLLLSLFFFIRFIGLLWAVMHNWSTPSPYQKMYESAMLNQLAVLILQVLLFLLAAVFTWRKSIYCLGFGIAMLAFYFCLFIPSAASMTLNNLLAGGPAFSLKLFIYFVFFVGAFILSILGLGAINRVNKAKGTRSDR